MTANQIAYWKNVETERANRAHEAIEQQRADIAQEEMLTNRRKATVSEGELELKKKAHKLNEAKVASDAIIGTFKTGADWLSASSKAVGTAYSMFS